MVFFFTDKVRMFPLQNDYTYVCGCIYMYKILVILSQVIAQAMETSWKAHVIPKSSTIRFIKSTGEKAFGI